MLKESGEHSIPTPRGTGGSPGGAAHGARRAALGARCVPVPIPLQGKVANTPFPLEVNRGDRYFTQKERREFATFLRMRSGGRPFPPE